MDPIYVQLGASRLENLPDQALRVFLDQAWIHFGDGPGEPSWLRRHWRRFKQARRGLTDLPSLYARTSFKQFIYAKGDTLPFATGSLHFIYSEHFFEHLFLDEALALFIECRRVLDVGGTLRVVVPDADLRTYAAPEPVGYPSRRMPFTHPDKHKTRWSVYSMTEALQLAGFTPTAIRYCDRGGVFCSLVPASPPGALTPALIADLSYIRRPDSLIVDAHVLAPTRLSRPDPPQA